ncbi:MAG TPA: hypothetical protein PLA50_15315 [Bacteroidia bacterium]|nr:hypothetical protein [Bacteroidia bacterium]
MILGPFIARHREIVPESLDGFSCTGYCFQAADGDNLLEIPIYYDEFHYFPGQRDFESFFVNYEDIPFSVYCHDYHIKYLRHQVTLVRFAPVFVGLCRHFGVDPIESLCLVRDVANYLQINSSLDNGAPLIPSDGLIHPRAEEIGFVLKKPHSYERSLLIDLNFRLGKLIDGSELETHAYQWRVRPTSGGKIGSLLIEQPDFERSFHLSDLFILALSAEGITSENLLTPAGEAALIANYEWTKLARMTNAEAKKGRLTIIAKNSELWCDLGALADLLISHELYSPNTSRSQIIKFLPKQIAEARKNTGPTSDC